MLMLVMAVVGEGDGTVASGVPECRQSSQMYSVDDDVVRVAYNQPLLSC